MFSLPGSENPLAVQRLSAEEIISECFHFRLGLVSEIQISPEEMVGKEGSVAISGPDEDRFFHGVLNRFALTSQSGKFYHYEADLVPHIWFMTLSSNFRIFQSGSVIEITEHLLKNTLPHQEFELRLTRNYEKRRYCTQYGESDWHFLARLFEEEGICFFFQHFPDRHVLILADDCVAYGPIDGTTSVEYRTDAGMVPEDETVRSFTFSRALGPDSVSLSNHNFKRPSLDLLQQAKTKDPQYEVYDYPSSYGYPERGKRLARVRLEEQLTMRDSAAGTSNCHRLSAGFTFGLANHDFADLDGDYLLLRVVHTGWQGHVLGEESGIGGDSSYSNEFVAIPAEVTPRPERILERPRGRLQTAIVVGPPGEEIYADEYGRVKVQFHWDRAGKRDENSSCWLRVSQPWSGPNWGFAALPRVGDEVLVDFINGDPDWPIIVGSVNNAQSPALYPLPEQRSRSGIRTRSYPAGGRDNFHELRFDDHKGQEEIYLQSERDWNILVKNEKSESVGSDSKEEIGGDKTTHAGRRIRIEAGDSIELVCGAASITLDSLGNMTLKGTNVEVSGAQQIQLASTKIDLN